MVEPAIPKVCFGVRSHLELSCVLCGSRVDTGRGKSLQMTATFARIDDVYGLIAAGESIADERKQHSIGFVIAVEERTDVTIFIKSRTSKLDSCSRLGHLSPAYVETLSVLISQSLQRNSISVDGHRRKIANKCRVSYGAAAVIPEEQGTRRLELGVCIVAIDVSVPHGPFDALDQVLYLKRLSEQARCSGGGGLSRQVRV